MDIFLFAKWRPPPSWILLVFILDGPRSLTDDMKLCLKFYVDPIYTFEDIAISIFRNLAKTPIPGPQNRVLWGDFAPKHFGLSSGPQKACTSLRETAHFDVSSKSVNRGDLQAR